LSCRFCHHANPSGAKFCNECGSPLHLRPCPRCEAVTDASAGACHQCGAPFDLEDVSSIAAVAEHAAATNEPRVDAPAIDDGRKQPPHTALPRARIFVRSDADEDAPASSELTRVAEPDASTHIPEWLADRFDSANRASASRDRTKASAVANKSGAADTPRRDEADEASSRPLLAEYDAHRPRHRVLPLLAIAAIGIAGAAYYAYDFIPRRAPVGAPTPAVSETATQSTNSSSAPAGAGATATAVPARRAAPPAAAPHTDAVASPAAAASPALPATVPAGVLATPSPRATRARSQRSNAPGASTSSRAAPAASDAEVSPGRAAQRERDAGETRRLIERELGPFITTPAQRPPR